MGRKHQVTNLAATGRVSGVVANTRLAIGYVGLDTAVVQANSGRSEILDVQFDISGGTSYVRPSLFGVLHPCDPNTGYRVGGNETFASLGDPADSPGAFPMPEGAPKDYLNNISASVAAFVSAPADPNNNGSPRRVSCHAVQP